MLRIFIGRGVSSKEMLDFCLRKIGVEKYEISKGSHGKPYLKDSPYFFNISHSREVIICAVADFEVGIDIEENTYRPRVAKLFSAEEQEAIEKASDKEATFTEIWTLKEAYAKYTGEGLSKTLLKNIKTKS